MGLWPFLRQDKNENKKTNRNICSAADTQRGIIYAELEPTGHTQQQKQKTVELRLNGDSIVSLLIAFAACYCEVGVAMIYTSSARCFDVVAKGLLKIFLGAFVPDYTV